MHSAARLAYLFCKTYNEPVGDEAGGKATPLPACSSAEPPPASPAGSSADQGELLLRHERQISLYTLHSTTHSHELYFESLMLDMSRLHLIQ